MLDLFHDGEWWWEVRRADGSLFDFGYTMDRQKAKNDYKDAVKRLDRELGV